MPVACRAAGIYVPDIHRDTGSKMHCPWGQVSHSDGGRDPAFRVWPDHGWCFSCREHFSPVKLASRVWEVSYEQAAIKLLDHVGFKPADYAHHWQRVAAPPELDRSAVAQALRNYCAALAPQHRLTEPAPAEYLARCLGFLTQVNDEAGAVQWLALSKQVMSCVLVRGEIVANQG
jgi:hypothetical protein